MSITVKHVSDGAQLSGAYDVRTSVFQVEQGIPVTDDFDGQDEQAEHFVALDGGRTIGTLRLRIITSSAKIERVAILKQYRGHGIGRQMMLTALTWLGERNVSQIYLESETDAIPFYEKLGFVKEGDVFVKVGLAHVTMVLNRQEI